MNTPPIVVSIGDLPPLFRSLEYSFAGAKEAGADGIELWLGVKSRYMVGRVRELVSKYELPLVSVHQPLWGSMGVLFDAGSYEVARSLGARTITCHPLPRVEVKDQEMRRYFARLEDVQARTGVQVLVENLPRVYRHPLLNVLFPPKQSAIAELSDAAKEYGLGLTFDTDHAHASLPHEEPWFDTIFPNIQNIHLSSFTKNQTHLPLSMGDLSIRAFLDYLKHRDYSGALTLEIAWPSATALYSYDFEELKKSIALIRQCYT